MKISDIHKLYLALIVLVNDPAISVQTRLAVKELLDPIRESLAES